MIYNSHTIFSGGTIPLQEKLGNSLEILGFFLGNFQGIREVQGFSKARKRSKNPRISWIYSKKSKKTWILLKCNLFSNVQGFPGKAWKLGTQFPRKAWKTWKARKSLNIIEQNYTFINSKFSWISWIISKKSLDFCSFSELLKVLGFLGFLRNFPRKIQGFPRNFQAFLFYGYSTNPIPNGPE